jgi:ankyrin repeat protein
LLDRGANVIALNMEYGWTPLFLAQHQHTLIFLFLYKGADVNAKANDGSTVLHWYASRGKLERMLLLLNYGCDIEAYHTARQLWDILTIT